MTDQVAADQADKPRRIKLKPSVASAVMLIGGMPIVLLWSLTASDPYWRLFEDEPVPAPIYEVGNPAAIPASYGPTLDPLAEVPRPSPALAAVNVMAATVSEPEVEPSPISGLSVRPSPRPPSTSAAAGEPEGAAPALVRVVRAGVDEATDVTIALQPVAMSAPGALRDLDPAGLGRLSTMVAPTASIEAPVPPHFAGDPSTEDALRLDRSDRVEVQRRLALAGFNPEGADGVFGPHTRAAIREAQGAWGFPTTGYLEPAFYADLGRRTADALQATQRNRPSLAPKAAPLAPERNIAQSEPGACARDESGRIIARQSLKCDLVGLKEGFGDGGQGAGTTTGGRRTPYVER